MKQHKSKCRTWLSDKMFILLENAYKCEFANIIRVSLKEFSGQNLNETGTLWTVVDDLLVNDKATYRSQHTNAKINLKAKSGTHPHCLQQR